MNRWAFAPLFLMLLGGCATSSYKDFKESSSHLPQQTKIPNVPLLEQTENFCGPAALSMVLKWSGDPSNMDDVAKHVYTPELQGSLQTDMLTAARRHGRFAMVLPRTQDTFEEVASGHPVVVLQNLGLSWYPRWHYAVVIGYDLTKDEVYLHSGENKVTALPLDTFYNTWSRSNNWSLLVLPTDQLPVTQRELDVTAAAVALEETAGADKAEPSYRAILKKWPQSLGARFGLSNTLYAAKKKSAAIAELQQLVKDYPQMAPAWHNLSLILKEEKQFKAAQSAALKAQETASLKEKEKYREQFLTH